MASTTTVVVVGDSVKAGVIVLIAADVAEAAPRPRLPVVEDEPTVPEDEALEATVAEDEAPDALVAANVAIVVFAAAELLL